jgi:hypothetical protein
MDFDDIRERSCFSPAQKGYFNIIIHIKYVCRLSPEKGSQLRSSSRTCSASVLTLSTFTCQPCTRKEKDRQHQSRIKRYRQSCIRMSSSQPLFQFLKSVRRRLPVPFIFVFSLVAWQALLLHHETRRNGSVETSCMKRKDIFEHFKFEGPAEQY